MSTDPNTEQHSMWNAVRQFFGITTPRQFTPIWVNFIGVLVAFIAVSLCILIVRTDLSYDSWIKDSSRAYRLHMTITPPGKSPVPLVAVSPRLSEALDRMPGIDRVTRLSREGMVIRSRGVSYNEVVQVVDSNFIETFGLPLTGDSLPDSLKAPDSAVLTRDAADKYFGRGNVVGQSLELASGGRLQITGILEPLPTNTHLDLNILVSASTPITTLNQQIQTPGPGEGVSYTYFWSEEGYSAKDIATQLPNVLLTTPAMPLEQAAVVNPVLGMMPVTEIHLNNFPMGELKPGGSRIMLGILIAIATTIIVITCINFSVLMIARAESRILEYGVRRTFGASRIQIALGNLREALGITVAAMVAAALFILALRPLVVSILGPSIVIDPVDFLLLLVPPVIVALAASAATVVPAGAVARLPPVAALKKETPAGRAVWQTIPVVFQFALATMIAVLSIVVALQTSFAVSQSLPSTGSDIFIVDSGLPPPDASVLRTVREQIAQLPGVQSVSLSQIVPTNFTTSMVGLFNQDEGQTTPTAFPSNAVDTTFFDVYGLPPVAGRLFSDSAAEAGRQVMLLGHAALQPLGFQTQQAAVGAHVTMMGPKGPVQFEILGVVPDIVMKSVDLPIEPLVFVPVRDLGRFVSVRLIDQNRAELVQSVERIWKQVTGQASINGRFLDEKLNDLYRSMDQSRRVLIALSLIAIAISCLGIYALTALLAVRQRHEIGIRRALGASRLNVATYVLLRFLVPIITGVLAAMPLALLISLYWLGGYSSRITLTALPFIVGGGSILIIGTLAVVQYTIQLTRTDPAVVIRS